MYIRIWTFFWEFLVVAEESSFVHQIIVIINLDMCIRIWIIDNWILLWWQNNPLYLQSFTESDDALKLHHIVHCSLDVVDERGNSLDLLILWLFFGIMCMNFIYGKKWWRVYLVLRKMESFFLVLRSVIYTLCWHPKIDYDPRSHNWI